MGRFAAGVPTLGLLLRNLAEEVRYEARMGEPLPGLVAWSCCLVLMPGLDKAHDLRRWFRSACGWLGCFVSAKI